MSMKYWQQNVGCGVDDRRRDVFIFQLAVVEGSLALIFQCARYVDLALVRGSKEKHELPKIRGLAACLKESGDGITVTMKPKWFE